MRINEIVEDMVFSKFLSAKSTATYVRYIQTGKLMVKSQRLHLFLGKLDKDALSAKALRITNRDDLWHYISSEQNSLFMV